MSFQNHALVPSSGQNNFYVRWLNSINPQPRLMTNQEPDKYPGWRSEHLFFRSRSAAPGTTIEALPRAIGVQDQRGFGGTTAIPRTLLSATENSPRTAQSQITVGDLSGPYGRGLSSNGSRPWPRKSEGSRARKPSQRHIPKYRFTAAKTSISSKRKSTIRRRWTERTSSTWEPTSARSNCDIAVQAPDARGGNTAIKEQPRRSEARGTLGEPWPIWTQSLRRGSSRRIIRRFMLGDHHAESYPGKRALIKLSIS